VSLSRLFDKRVGVFLKLMARPFYDEMDDVARTVRAGDLDWTLVRVPMRTDFIFSLLHLTRSMQALVQRP
jgi:hypothetical protein